MPHLGLLNKILDFTLHLPVGLNFLYMSSMEIRDVDLSEPVSRPGTVTFTLKNIIQ